MTTRSASAPTLDDALARGANAFNALRLFAAVAVIASHAVALRHGLVHEPLEDMTPWSLAGHAVNVFFVLSGFLISASFVRHADPVAFVVARALRIFPGLIVCAIVIAFGLGPLTTSAGLGDYLRSVDLWLYPLRAGLLMDETARLPGVFEAAPMPGAVNDPLWTLRFELACYVGVAMLGLAGLLSRKRVVAALALLFVAAQLVLDLVFERPDQPELIDEIVRFGALFALGSAAYAFRTRIRPSLWAIPICAAAAFASAGADVAPTVWLIATAVVTLTLGCCGAIPLRDFADRTDLSYGLYIYGWPVGQTIVHAAPAIDVPTLIATSTLGAASAAALSWRCVERPCIQAKDRIAAALARAVRRSAAPG